MKLNFMLAVYKHSISSHCVINKPNDVDMFNHIIDGYNPDTYNKPQCNDSNSNTGINSTTMFNPVLPIALMTADIPLLVKLPLMFLLSGPNIASAAPLTSNQDLYSSGSSGEHSSGSEVRSLEEILKQTESHSLLNDLRIANCALNSLFNGEIDFNDVLSNARYNVDAAALLSLLSKLFNTHDPDWKLFMDTNQADLQSHGLHLRLRPLSLKELSNGLYMEFQGVPAKEEQLRIIHELNNIFELTRVEAQKLGIEIPEFKLIEEYTNRNKAHIVTMRFYENPQSLTSKGAASLYNPFQSHPL